MFEVRSKHIITKSPNNQKYRVQTLYGGMVKYSPGVMSMYPRAITAPRENRTPNIVLEYTPLTYYMRWFCKSR